MPDDSKPAEEQQPEVKPLAPPTLSPATKDKPREPALITALRDSGWLVD